MLALDADAKVYGKIDVSGKDGRRKTEDERTGRRKDRKKRRKRKRKRKRKRLGA